MCTLRGPAGLRLTNASTGPRRRRCGPRSPPWRRRGRWPTPAKRSSGRAPADPGGRGNAARRRRSRGLAAAPTGRSRPTRRRPERGQVADRGLETSSRPRSQPYSLDQLDDLLPEVEAPTLARQLTKMRSSRQIARPRGEGGPPPTSSPNGCGGRSRRLRSPAAVSAGTCRASRRRSPGSRWRPPSFSRSPSSRCRQPCGGAASGRAHGHRRSAGGNWPRGEAGRGHGRGRARPGRRLRGQGHRSPSTWGLGAPDAWLDAVIDGDSSALRFGGAQPRLPLALAKGLHQELFGA